MATLEHYTASAVHAYETDDGFVVEVELPAEDPSIRVEQRGRLLKLTIAARETELDWEPNLDGAS